MTPGGRIACREGVLMANWAAGSAGIAPAGVGGFDDGGKLPPGGRTPLGPPADGGAPPTGGGGPAGGEGRPFVGMIVAGCIAATVVVALATAARALQYDGIGMLVACPWAIKLLMLVGEVIGAWTTFLCELVSELNGCNSTGTSAVGSPIPAAFWPLSWIMRRVDVPMEVVGPACLGAAPATGDGLLTGLLTGDSSIWVSTSWV